MIMSPLVSIALLWLMKLLIDNVFLAKEISLLPTLAVAYVILVTAKLLMDYAQTRTEASLTEQLNQNVRVDLYRHVISVSPGTFRTYSVGDILGRIYSDVEKVGYLIYSGPIGVIFNVLAAAAYIGFLVASQLAADPMCSPYNAAAGVSKLPLGPAGAPRGKGFSA